MFLQLPSRVSTFVQYHLKYQAILTNLKPRNLTRFNLKRCTRTLADLKSRNRTRANATLTDPKAPTLADPKRRHAPL